MTSAIRPYTHAAKPPTRREPVPPAPTPMSPNAAWLDKCAEHWQAQGCVLYWNWDAAAGCYVGFNANSVGRGCVAEVYIDGQQVE